MAANTAGDAAPRTLGWLVLRVEEATGKTQHEKLAWDATPLTPGAPWEAFVKVELRGGARSVKVQTQKAPLAEETLTFQEELHLEMLEGASELRIMLCREKLNSAGKKGVAVIAACGIFVEDILDAVPIDKYFELFKPNSGGDGGFIRISMGFVKDLTDLRNPPSASPSKAKGTAAAATTSAGGASARKGKSGLRTALAVLLSVGALGAAAAGVAVAARRNKKEDVKKSAPPPPAPPPAPTPAPAKKGFFF